MALRVMGSRHEDRREGTLAAENLELFRTTTDALVERIAKGDLSPLDVLLRKAGKRVMALITVKMTDRLKLRMGPEDVLQEVYLEALRQLPSFEDRGHGSFYAWFAVLAVNKISNLDQLARAARRDPRREVLLDQPGRKRADRSTRRMEIAADGTSPSGIVIRWEVFEGIRSALDGLSPLEREALVLRYLQGLSSAEAAGILKVGISQVYVALSRALAKVRDHLGDL
jgi:RNA polymerase sigma-70 factor (ECF subfamily)